MDDNNKMRVAIACQGGGSHTAFTAGALKVLLTKGQEKYDFVAFSGTSGGAICALLAWYALLKNGTGKAGRDKAAELLNSFWLRDNSANLLPERLWNDSIIQWIRWQQENGFLIEYSPNFFSDLAQDRLRRMIEKNVNFGEIDDEFVKPSSPMLFVGAVNVLTGEFMVFKSHKLSDPDENGGAFVFNDSRDNGISVDALLASAAIPPIFKAVRIGEGVYWDGLYAQNPPIRDLPDANPDEIWVIQINPNKIVPTLRAKPEPLEPKPGDEPKKIANITDRRNELSGNISLNQEIFFIKKINELVDEGLLSERSKYKHIEVREPIENLSNLDYATKLDRNPSFIREMMAYGERQAEDFLSSLPHA